MTATIYHRQRLSNAILYFPRQTGRFEIDEDTGDEIEVVSNASPIQIAAMISPATAKLERPHGSNLGSTAFAVQGRLTNPSTFSQAGVGLNYTDPILVEMNQIKGRLLLTPTIQNPALVNWGYLSKVGETIVGWLELGGAD